MPGKWHERLHVRWLIVSLAAVSYGLLWHAALTVTGKTVLLIDARPLRAAPQAKAGVAPSAVAAAAESFGIPVHLWIPSIDVNAPIEQAALKKDGSMDVPALPLDVAWYSLGPRPGETGNAAIAGHVDWWKGETAAFKDLRKLKPGDSIVVEDDKGTDVSFVMRESREYDAAAVANDVFVSNDGKAHLNLITCHGAWDKKAGQYSKRLVVFADKQE